jgi:predicted glycosyltransferase
MSSNNHKVNKLCLAKMTIWIDIENVPNVLFFEPIVNELKKRGHKVLITARDYAQTLDMLDMYSINYKIIGRHYGKNIFMKIMGGIIRSLQLFWWTLDKKIDIGLGFGIRSIVLTCRLINIPNITIYDYGYFFVKLLNRYANKIIIPIAIPIEFVINRGGKKKKIFQFPGTKEEVYAGRLKLSVSNRILKDLDIDRSKIIILIRPSATLAHYHNKESEMLFAHIIDIISIKKELIGIIFPRTKEQIEELSRKKIKNIYILKKPVNGLELIWNSDIVISGWVTMIREEAALVIHAYRIFTGEKTWVDKELAKQDKIKFIEDVNDINRISFKKRKKKINDIYICKQKSDFLINFIIKEIESFSKSFKPNIKK